MALTPRNNTIVAKLVVTVLAGAILGSAGASVTFVSKKVNQREFDEYREAAKVERTYLQEQIDEQHKFNIEIMKALNRIEVSNMEIKTNTNGMRKDIDRLIDDKKPR